MIDYFLTSVIINLEVGARIIVFNATFNNISCISWCSVLLMEENRVLRENHWPAASSLHRKLFDPQAIRTSWVVEFRSPNANLLARIKTKIISHVYYYINWQLIVYSLTKISSFSCSGCFQPRATNFPFLVLVTQINCIYIFLNIVC